MKIGNITSGFGYHQLPPGTTAQRPASPIQGMTRYNTTIGGWDFYDGSAWSTHAYKSISAADAIDSEQKHFVYDTTRSKFLSTEGNSILFQSRDIVNNDYIWPSGLAFNAVTSVLMPFNGTIIGWSIYLADTRSVRRSVSVFLDSTEHTLQFVAGNSAANGEYELAKTNSNLDFNAGHRLRVRMIYSSGNSGNHWTNMNLHMYYKWRMT